MKTHIKKLKKLLEYGSEITSHWKDYSIDPLTIQEFSFLRETMYAVKTSNSPSAYQAKEFFRNEENFELVVEKLRKLLEYESKLHK